MALDKLLKSIAKQYHPLTATPLARDMESADESLLPQEKHYDDNFKQADRGFYLTMRTMMLLIMLPLLVLNVIGVTILLFGLGRSAIHTNIDDLCFEHSTYYSPVVKDIDTTPRLVTTNGSLNWPSVYRLPPGPEVDDAWNKISYNMGVFSLPEDVALKAGLHKGDVRIPAGYMGSGEYMASLELTHQLHCVDFLRKAVWFNYPHYKTTGGEFKDPQHVLENHLYHCLETLRQVIMCNADTGIVGYKFVRGREKRPYPDFNTPHKCRDWQGIIDWAYERSIPGHPEESDFVPGEDEIVYDMDP